MSSRFTHGLRVNRALFALEAREQVRLGLAAVALAVLLVRFLRVVTGLEPGEFEVRLPFLPLGVAGLCAAFLAADAWSRDTRSGFDRALTGSPLTGRLIVIPRFAISLLCAVAVAAAVMGFEPPGEGWSTIGSHAREVPAIVSAVVFSALAGLALRHSLGAALVGAALGNLPIWLCAWSGANPPTNDFDALVRMALVAYFDSSTLPITLASGVVALCFAMCVRGRCSRSPWRRCALAAAAAAGFAAPGIVGAASAVHALVWVSYDQPGALIFTTPSPDGARAIVHVNRELTALGDGKDRRWTSEFIVDTATGTVERLPANKNFHGYWIDAHTVAFHDRWDEDDGKIYALDLDSGRTWLHDSDWSDGFMPWIIERKVRNSPRDYFEYRVRASSGALSQPVRGFGLRSHHGGRTFLLDEDQRIVELFADGRPPSYHLDIELRGERRGLSLSPDERWLRVVEYREVVAEGRPRPEPFALLFDLHSNSLAAEIVGRPWSWRRGPAPMLLQLCTPGDASTQLEGTSRWVLVGPDGIEPWPFDCTDGPPVDLDGERWLVETRAGGIAVHAADGTLLRTLRRPSPGEAR